MSQMASTMAGTLSRVPPKEHSSNEGHVSGHAPNNELSSKAEIEEAPQKPLHEHGLRLLHLLVGDCCATNNNGRGFTTGSSNVKDRMQELKHAGLVVLATRAIVIRGAVPNGAVEEILPVLPLSQEFGRAGEELVDFFQCDPSSIKYGRPELVSQLGPLVMLLFLGTSGGADLQGVKHLDFEGFEQDGPVKGSALEFKNLTNNAPCLRRSWRPGPRSLADML
ncbi:hypothetical protein CONPUDRAFT_73040 [Coniophora puteana RWD-64-598 SS2]|uniref:Uncharacterized protein n=1 Tax=Coniophora puteana (strain RWD-64-598) TaxID=741705 RepID=A0A5M3MPZ7_CONPW|nr:uncharacterized protein CONPUDRAFT_73040 [Coniophora puteana RWD-64-598 SS2]EIW81258.1 hypothetical protein CONPUDRAFT_73040 [Coniophora puteana RWD-64-598 SS2]